MLKLSLTGKASSPWGNIRGTEVQKEEAISFAEEVEAEAKAEEEVESEVRAEAKIESEELLREEKMEAEPSQENQGGTLP